MTISAPMTISWRAGRSSPAGDCHFCFSVPQTLDIARRTVTPSVVNISVLNRPRPFCSASDARSLVG